MKSIRNYVNTQDFVTGVPLTAWGYDKYGVTEVFESTDYRRNNDAFARAYLSLGKVGMKVNNDGKGAVKNFGKAARNVDEYYNKISTSKYPPYTALSLFDLCYNAIASAAMGKDSFTTTTLKMMNHVANKKMIIGFFFWHKNTTIFYSHTPETYYAYISQRW